jgi:hypothetical protein
LQNVTHKEEGGAANHTILGSVALRTSCKEEASRMKNVISIQSIRGRGALG